MNMLPFDEDEQVSAILPVRNFEEGKSVVMVTKQGVIKRVDLMDFSNVRRGGIKATLLDEGDTLIAVRLTEGNRDCVISMKSGMAIRFKETDVRVMGRISRGVRAVTLDADDEVVNIATVPRDERAELPEGVEVTENPAPEGMDRYALLTICRNGYGKRTFISEYRLQSRGGKGVIDIKTTDRNGPVVGSCRVDEDDHVMLITTAGKVIRIAANNISLIGRNTQGVRVINLDEGEAVAAVARVAEGASEDPAAAGDEGELVAELPDDVIQPEVAEFDAADSTDSDDSEQ